MTNLEKAAQAVLVRWDSPAWDWAHQGPTAALMADLREALAAHKQAEPVMIYHGEYTIDCGNHGHHNVELLKLIADGTKLYAGPRQAEPVVEPSYFGLTKDHTWLSVSKEQYDKLKPKGRMACIVRSEK